MAKIPAIPPRRKTSLVRIVDLHGDLVMDVSYESYRIVLPNGGVHELDQSQNIQLVCGTIWNAGMMLRKDAILLSVYELCRHPPFDI